MRDMSRPIKGDNFSDEIKNYDFQFDVDNRGKNSIAIAIDTEEELNLLDSWFQMLKSLCVIF